MKFSLLNLNVSHRDQIVKSGTACPNREAARKFEDDDDVQNVFHNKQEVEEQEEQVVGEKN